MPICVNRVILAGYLTRDPESRQAGSGQVVEFGLALNRTWTDRSGQRREDTVFVKCTAWGWTGEVLVEHVGRGDPVLVEGRLTLDRWKDRETGADRERLKVVAERVQFLGQVGGRKPSRRTNREAKQSTDDDVIPF